MSNQLALFDAPKTPTDRLSGIQVKLPDNCGKCRDTVAIIGPGRGPHRAELLCHSCGSHRGWLSHTTYAFIADIANKFGCPTTPIVIRRGSMCTKEIADAGF